LLCSGRLGIRRATVVVAATLGGALSYPASAQAPAPRDTGRAQAYRGRLLGLFDQTTGQPIEGAEVFDVGTGWSAKTTATGTVSLVFLPDGGGLVRIRKVGYAAVFTRVAISPADTAPITLLLSRLTELPAVVTNDSTPHLISGNLRGFEERARLKLAGYFINDTLLRKSENRTLSNLIRSQFPGIAVRLRDGPFAATYFGGDQACAQVFLDGVPMNSDGVPMNSSGGRGSPRKPPPFNLNSIQISDLHGVEYYRSGGIVPVEFSSERTGCGALMLWTRER
jgi:hypothetical protein